MSWSGSWSEPTSAPQTELSLRAFDEPFAFRIRHIEAILNVNSPGLAFPSGRWKPPTQTSGVRFLSNVRYLGAPQSTIFLWQPIPNRAVSKTSLEEQQFYRPYRTSTLFWANDSHTFMHVPFDCTEQDVENPAQDDSEFEDDDTGRTSMDDLAHQPARQSSQSRRFRATWRRLKFHFEYPPLEQPMISRVCYGGGNFLGGTLPAQWRSTLMPSVHEHPEISYATDCQLAGDLPTLLGLTAFCQPFNELAINAVANWFPPSRGTTRWNSIVNPHQTHSMQMCDQRRRRGMVIETFYDLRRQNSKEILEAWESGRNGPIIT